ncbi:MAG TPA: hypothetical protein PLM14_06550 [Candidatus Hydrogenedentes bacterium]|nr:hypothetical protein [Candidatus Hydrogenedentota bacterium]HQH51885.1 hypothetical protein [Candidatus Hydrogenedentota bacterium]
MQKPIAWIVTFFLIIAAACMTGCPSDPKANASLHFYNDATDDYVRGIYLQRSGYDDWGVNLITDEILPGHELMITHLYPGTYSIKVAVRASEGWYFGMIPSETLTLVSNAALQFRYARGTWEIGGIE